MLSCKPSAREETSPVGSDPQPGNRSPLSPCWRKRSLPSPGGGPARPQSFETRFTKIDARPQSFETRFTKIDAGTQSFEMRLTKIDEPLPVLGGQVMDPTAEVIPGRSHHAGLIGRRHRRFGDRLLAEQREDRGGVDQGEVLAA